MMNKSLHVNAECNQYISFVSASGHEHVWRIDYGICPSQGNLKCYVDGSLKMLEKHIFSFVMGEAFTYSGLLKHFIIVY